MSKITKSSTKSSTGHHKKAKGTFGSKYKFGTVVSRKLLILVCVVAALSLVLLGWVGVNAWNNAQVKGRLSRIEHIYSSLNLDQDNYAISSYQVFGDKRPYDYDKSRTESSAITYIHGDTVSNTAAELDAKIKASGFAFIDEPYAGSVQKQYHYKSSKGEYIRLTVSSKPYDDAWQNSSAMNQSMPDLPDGFDTNQGPVNVTIKVNLDDNNE